MNMSKPTVERKTAAKASAGRLIFAGISVLVEFFFLVILATSLNEYAEWISITTRLISLILVLLIYSRYQTASLKMPWIILILVLPVVGVTMYLLVGFAWTPHRLQRSLDAIDERLFPLLRSADGNLEKAALFDRHLGNISSYIQHKAHYPVYTDTEVTYYPDTKLALQAMLNDLRSAKKFIFMEYHAIENAESWIVIQDILTAKVKAGVEVRVFYDDMGSIFFLNRDFRRQLQEAGIHCRVFNPIVPFLKLIMNNRDHRKILVVDGKVGYTGGFNIANEYFNLTHPYGHWKDAGIRLEGPAVRSLTAMFLEMWNAIRDNDADDLSYEKYLPARPAEQKDDRKADHHAAQDADMHTGFVQPYGDVPTDHEQVGENVYIAMIEQAVDYIYFSTPYLILTEEMSHALSLAARRGVDVRIITPGIPDKKMVYEVTRSYYHGLVRNGVRIFEYTPGFNHAKLCVTDDHAAICGTINLDFRSLYHHFEDAVLFYGCPQVMDIKKDFLDTFPRCHEVTQQYHTGRSNPLRFGQIILRLFAPLL